MPTTNPKSSEKKKDGRGRPSVYNEKKLKRNYSLTDTAHDGLLDVALENGMESRSELLEDIGRKEALVSYPDSSGRLSQEIPIYSRFLDIMKEPVCRFRSTLSWARIVAYQLGIVESEEKFYEKEKMVADVVRAAFVIIAVEDYLYPDEYLMDVTSTMHWLIYRMLLKVAGIEQKSPTIDTLSKYFDSSKSANIKPEKEVHQIFNAFSRVKENYPLHYQIMYMRMMEEFSYTQVCKIQNLRDNQINEKDALLKVKQFNSALRQAVHYMMDENIIDRFKGEEDDRLYGCMKNCMKDAQSFYDLITKGDSGKINGEKHEELREEIECWLIKAMLKPSLSLWLGEVMHVWGHKFAEDAKMNSEQYNNCQRNATNAVADSLEQEVRTNLEDLKSKLKFCATNQEDIKETVMSVVNKVAGVEIPEEYFYKKRKFLEHYVGEYCKNQEISKKQQACRESGEQV